MRILHISDIHFQAPMCLSPHTDPDVVYRTRITREIESDRHANGDFDVIIVGGDIAYKGQPAEFEAARAWFSELAKAAGCSEESIYVVPGNHDVDRSIARNNVTTANAQSAIHRAANREYELRRQMYNIDAASALFAPLAAYNEFAAAYDCQTYLPDRLLWRHDLELEHGITLRMCGLNSVLLSGLNGNNDIQGDLYLSPFQTNLNPDKDVIYLTVCHHPPDWFSDGRDIDSELRSRACIQLFGHVHDQNVYRDADYIRLPAAAVNPPRTEGGWSPGFNILELTVFEDAAGKHLRVDAHLLEWQSKPTEMYRRKKDRNHSDVFSHTITLNSTSSRSAPIVVPAETVPVETVLVEATMDKPENRNIIRRFWNLSPSQRGKICADLNLLTEQDAALPEIKRWRQGLLKAAETNQLDAVIELITNFER